jgi:hypothetical protein
MKISAKNIPFILILAVIAANRSQKVNSWRKKGNIRVAAHFLEIALENLCHPDRGETEWMDLAAN